MQAISKGYQGWLYYIYTYIYTYTSGCVEQSITRAHQGGIPSEPCVTCDVHEISVLPCHWVGPAVMVGVRHGNVSARASCEADIMYIIYTREIY